MTPSIPNTHHYFLSYGLRPNRDDELAVVLCREFRVAPV